MAQIPRLVVRDGNKQEGSEMFDLTNVLVDRLKRYSDTRRRISDRTLQIEHLGSRLPDDFVHAWIEGHVQSSDFFEASEVFLARVPTDEHVDRLSTAVHRIEALQRGIETQTKRYGQVAAARWETDVSKFGFLYEDSAHGWDDGYRSTEGALGDADVFVAFGTRAIHWTLTARTLREWVEERAEEGDGPVTAEGMLPEIIENEMSEHHEDAEDDIVDQDGLWELVGAWLPHAGRGTPEDLDLEPRLEEWNRRQRLVSYMVDFTVAAPLLPGLTREAALDRIQGLVDASRRELAMVEAGWIPDAEMASSTPVAAF